MITAKECKEKAIQILDKNEEVYFNHLKKMIEEKILIASQEGRFSVIINSSNGYSIRDTDSFYNFFQYFIDLGFKISLSLSQDRRQLLSIAVFWKD